MTNIEEISKAVMAAAGHGFSAGFLACSELGEAATLKDHTEALEAYLESIRPMTRPKQRGDW